MADQSMLGFGANLSVNDGTGSAYQAFNNVLQFSLPDSEVGEYETTLLQQFDGSGNPIKDRTFAPTLVDNGTVSVEGFFTKAEYVRLRGLRGKNGMGFKLHSPDPDGTGSTLTAMCASFNGFIKKVGGVKFEKDKEVMCTFEIRVSGAVTITDDANATADPTEP